MGKILEAFRKFQQDVHEIDNANQLQAITPDITVYNMLHHFTNQKHPGSKNTSWITTFTNILNKQPNVYHNALNAAAYNCTNPQNQVLLHGILFKGLFDLYMQYLKKGFDNVFLSDIQTAKNNKTIIDFVEYYNLPKRFRGIFVQYDADHYVLNVPQSEMVITYKKGDKNKLEELLLRAKMLIPVIYKEVSTPASFNDSYIIHKYKKPAFVLDSPSAKCVNDEQMATIHELQELFADIAKITLPRIVTQKESAAAKEIYAEYQKELNQQGIFVRAQNNAKELKANQNEIIRNDYKAFKRKKKQLKANYREFHSGLLAMLKNETCIYVK